MPALATKRVYAPAKPSDGKRVLVDRLWPRGMTKERAAVDYWARELSPSHALRRWFSHTAERWDEFEQRFHDELERPEAQEEIAAVRKLLHEGPVTLVYAAREERMNNAVALCDYLGRRH